MKWLAIVLSVVLFGSFSQLPPKEPTYRERIKVLWKFIEKSFKDSATGYYRETNFPKPDVRPFSYLWPLCGLLQAANECERVGELPGLFDKVLKDIQVYFDSTGPTGAYGSYIVDLNRDSRFYDDNQWIGIACMDAYSRTRNLSYLEQGKLVYRFMMTGYDNKSKGGLYWQENDKSTKNTCSNGPGIILALQLYEATRDKSYLDTAKQLYEWVLENLQTSSGLFYDHVLIPSMQVDKRIYTYNSGTLIQSSVMLYSITNDKKYLRRAQKFAQTAYLYFFKNNSLPPNYWFNAVLLRGFIALYRADKNERFLVAMKKYAEQVWNYENNGKNFVGLQKNKELLDQSAMIEIFARLTEFENKESQ